MRINKLPYTMMLAMTAMAAAMLFTAPRASAQEQSVLMSFKKRTDSGNYPRAGLTFDSAGNLYGTTSQGGAGGAGTVFELSPKAGGGWIPSILYSFTPKPKYDLSEVSGVVFDKAGNLYGTTYLGGNKNDGRVFKLSKQADGTWTETTIHNFQNNGTDGFGPQDGIIIDSAGNLYGTTVYGGTGTGCDFTSCGIAYELTQKPNGLWTETILHNFAGGDDGGNPYVGLTFDTAGNLYGTTEFGGMNGGGVAFQLSPAGGGNWTETVVHSFGSGADADQAGGLTFYGGSLYGAAGGNNNGGDIFELSPAGGGVWTESILATFVYGNAGQNPYDPAGNLVFDASGNMYGVSEGGSGLTGTVFELSPAVDGTWDLTILYNFNDLGSTGSYPFPPLILDSHGNIYGTTEYGGLHDAGVVFEIKP